MDAVDDLGAASGAKGHRFESCIARTLKSGSEARGFFSLASGPFVVSEQDGVQEKVPFEVAGGRMGACASVPASMTMR